ncbi:MAG: MurR/RpiR family transcriptional regulator [Ilumatobacteraceae bacterium]
MEVAERIREHSADLTAAERRVAEVVLAAPQSVGFGTVADLARSAQVGAASVVRLASKLGFDGFSELQHAVQRELTQQLRPAAERIQDSDLGSRSDQVALELANVRATLTGIDDGALASLVERLADLDRPVVILSGHASAGVAQQFASQLQQLRPGVQVVAGSDVLVRRDLAVLAPSATAIVVDLRRYERWVLEAHRLIADRSIWSAGVTDSMLSPVASVADVAFVVDAASTGPFDSYVGVLSLLNLVTADLATRLKESAAQRLAVVEAAWSEHESLTSSHLR